jgi:TrmH family RNA methyltransferase
MNFRSTVVRSTRNPLVRRARAIERDPAARRKEGLYVAWGLHLVQEALASGAPIRLAILAPALEGTQEGRRIRTDLLRLDGPIVRVTSAILDGIVPGAADQGILLLIERRAGNLEEMITAGTHLLMVTHGVQDPGNLGSIARTALALGAQGLVVLEGCADPFGSRVVRAAMGAHFRLPIVRCAGAACLPALREAAMRIVAADPRGTEIPEQVDLRLPTALVLGNEGRGLPGPILAAADHRVRIPMHAGVSSLNVHAAAAMLLFEAARQRRLATP